MRIRIGYDIAFNSATPTPTILMLSVHPSRLDDLTKPHRLTFDPPIPSHTYTDHFGNICTRIVMPPGILTVSSDNVVCDSGLPDAVEVPSRFVLEFDWRGLRLDEDTWSGSKVNRLIGEFLGQVVPSVHFAHSDLT
jgi:hypothetical protein